MQFTFKILWQSCLLPPVSHPSKNTTKTETVKLLRNLKNTLKHRLICVCTVLLGSLPSALNASHGTEFLSSNTEDPLLLPSLTTRAALVALFAPPGSGELRRWVVASERRWKALLLLVLASSRAFVIPRWKVVCFNKPSEYDQINKRGSTHTVIGLFPLYIYQAKTFCWSTERKIVYYCVWIYIYLPLAVLDLLWRFWIVCLHERGGRRDLLQKK